MALKTAIVGIGWWGRHIIDSTNSSKKIKITTAVDKKNRISTLRNEITDLPITDNFNDILNNDEIQAVILATPHTMHEHQIRQCALAGKHIFVEKPLALTYESALRSISLCHQNNLVLGVGHERRFEPAFEALKELLSKNSLGTLIHVESNFSHDLLVDVDPKSCRASDSESPIPALTSMGIHLTDMYIHLFGDIHEVFAHHTHRYTNWGTGDNLSVQVKFKSGITGYFSTILATSMYIRFQVFGSHGWAEIRSDVHPGDEGITQLNVTKSNAPMKKYEFEYQDTVLKNLETFADAINMGTPYPFTSNEKLKNISTMVAINKSANIGQPIVVD